MAGAFITIGALFSSLIATGTDNEGIVRLLEGFGFSVGFFLVVLSGALLFTKVNVELPATLLGHRSDQRGSPTLRTAVFKLWVVAAVGNLIGAFAVGQIVAYTSDYGGSVEDLLSEVMATKMRYQAAGGAEAFFKAILSGVVANWLVGTAAFLATMGRAVIGKYIPVLLIVMAFVAGGFLHSPANMAYLSLVQPLGVGPGWGDGLLWSVLPAAIGNILGAFFLVALPFHIASQRLQHSSYRVGPASDRSRSEWPRLFPLQPLVGLRGVFGGRANIVPNSALRRLLDEHVTFDLIEESTVPFSVIVTDVMTGREVRIDEGPAISAILASAAIPGVFPPVRLNGRDYMDGGIVYNTPISQAIAAGATDVWVLSTGYSCALSGPPLNAMAMAFHGLSMLVQQRFAAEALTRSYPVPVHLIPTPCPIDVASTDLCQSARLIERARRGTAQWNANGQPHSIPLLGHDHMGRR